MPTKEFDYHQRPNTKAYEEGMERIFGKKKRKKRIEKAYTHRSDRKKKD